MGELTKLKGGKRTAPPFFFTTQKKKKMKKEDRFLVASNVFSRSGCVCVCVWEMGKVFVFIDVCVVLLNTRFGNTLKGSQ